MSKEFAGSPGPWRRDETKLLVDRDGNVVSRFEEANARLIAAAPEMLKLLRDLATCQFRDAGLCDGCRNNIAVLLARIDGPSPVLDPEGTK